MIRFIFHRLQNAICEFHYWYMGGLSTPANFCSRKSQSLVDCIIRSNQVMSTAFLSSWSVYYQLIIFSQRPKLLNEAWPFSSQFFYIATQEANINSTKWIYRAAGIGMKQDFSIVMYCSWGVSALYCGGNLNSRTSQQLLSNITIWKVVNKTKRVKSTASNKLHLNLFQKETKTINNS